MSFFRICGINPNSVMSLIEENNVQIIKQVDMWELQGIRYFLQEKIYFATYRNIKDAVYLTIE